MTLAALCEPSRTAIVPSLVIDEDGLKKAMTISGLAWSVSQAVGSSMGSINSMGGHSSAFAFEWLLVLSYQCLIHLEDKGRPNQERSLLLLQYLQLSTSLYQLRLGVNTMYNKSISIASEEPRFLNVVSEKEKVLQLQVKVLSQNTARYGGTNPP